MTVLGLVLASVGLVCGIQAAWIWFGASTMRFALTEVEGYASGDRQLSRHDVARYVSDIIRANRQAARLAAVAVLSSSAASLLASWLDGSLF